MPIEFTMNVDQNGNLTFVPAGPDDWLYQNGQTLRFKSRTGPFVIQLIPMTANLPKNPFGADFLVSSDTPQGDFWFVDVTVNDGLTDAQRTNMARSMPTGFLERYIYRVTVGHRGEKCGSHTGS
ncbi:MAG: hypothetical protein FJW40_05030 [Acidobacteria bacterium]|nr:hypothetical protein [Acidobacteriota bacterium]